MLQELELEPELGTLQALDSLQEPVPELVQALGNYQAQVQDPELERSQEQVLGQDNLQDKLELELVQNLLVLEQELEQAQNLLERGQALGNLLEQEDTLHCCQQ